MSGSRKSLKEEKEEEKKAIKEEDGGGKANLTRKEKSICRYAVLKRRSLKKS